MENEKVEAIRPRGSSLEQIIQALGFTSVYGFAKHQARQLLAEKVAYFQSRVDWYERKYGMTFEEFRQRVIDPHDTTLARFGIFEKEDDDMEWESALVFLGGYQKDFDALA